MSPILKFIKSLASVSMCLLVLIGPIDIITRQSQASNNSLPRSLTQGVREFAAETGPQARTVDEATRSRVSGAYNKLPLSFEENRGQVDGEVKYVSRGSGYTLFLTSTEAVLTLQRAGGGRRHEKRAHDHLNPHSTLRNPPSACPPSAVLRMKLAGASQSPAIRGEREMGVRTNYFIGNDPQKWHTDVTRYERVRYEQVYPGVDMIYYGRQQQLEYDFEVAPGADARRIALEYTGVKRVKIERKTGELVLKTAGGEVRQHKPVAYQEVGGERREVASRYVVKGQRQVGIEVGEYDRTQSLVIDPVLSYSTYLGGSDYDAAFGIAVDASGHAYVTGYTGSSDFPKSHPYQTTPISYLKAFITKLDTNASGAASLLYSSYLGGNHSDVPFPAEIGNDIAVDESGIVYVTGQTGSLDFPVLNQYQTYQGGADAFVTKLDTNLSGKRSLLYSTYLGGNSTDIAHSIAIDASGHAYVTGETLSTDFPILNQYQSFQGKTDVFVTKLDTNTAGTASLLYSTYLGGRNHDVGWGIAADSSGHAYVMGDAWSGNFPTKNQYQSDQRGFDAFVTKLDTNASGAASLLYSTYLGGRSYDSGFGIAADESGMAYVTGWTQSSDFPLKNQYQALRGGLNAFVTKLDTNTAGTASLLYSTCLGGGWDTSFNIALDSSGNVYVTGWASSTDFPLLNQYQTDQGAFDAYVAKLNPNLAGAASLLYSTYLGGNDNDYGWGIAVDSSGNVYVSGDTWSNDFPKLHQYSGKHAVNFYNNDAFVTKLITSYNVSGRVTSDGTTGLGGVTMTVTGSMTGTVLTDSTGNYSIELAVGGNYTVTPSRSDLTFVPSKRSFANLQANKTNVNFMTQPATISGKVTKDTADGAGLPGVTITLTSGDGFTPRTVNTASNGTYSFSNLPTPGNYKIKPSKTNYLFNPSYLVLYNVTANRTNASFVATLKTYTLNGRITQTGTSTGISEVMVRLESPTPAGFAARTVQTTSTGYYTFTNLPAGRNYSIKPTKTGFTFSPMTRSITNLSSNIPAGASTNFTGTGP